jgi:hypothetical protein
MTFAEALVYAAALAQTPTSRMGAYSAVLNLRSEQMPATLDDQTRAATAMLDEFRRFTPTVRAQPPGLMETLFK